MKFKKDVGAEASANLIGKAQQIRVMGIQLGRQQLPSSIESDIDDLHEIDTKSSKVNL